MNLKEVLKGIDYTIIDGEDNININKIEYDSRKISEGDVFFCIEGYSTDGHKYVNSAIEKGAKVIICQKDLKYVPKSSIVIKVKDSRKALAVAGANYYGNPAKELKIIGVTGTNGKTTSTFMIKSILEAAGYKVGIIGTIANYIGNKRITAHRTTPESLELHKLFKYMVKEGIDYCIMEVSSHSLYLDRVYGIKFSQAIFTNLTQDHLDFHKTFENYYNAKLKLFKSAKSCIINVDDKYGKNIFKDALGNKYTYSIEEKSDVKAHDVIMHSRGIEFSIDYKGKEEKISLNIPGRYNILNALGSLIACLKEGVQFNDVKKGLESMLCVPGRSEIVTQNYNLGYEVIVDYAHTPDGLKNILSTSREFTKGRLISVFGCGGDRDNTKRPIMGKIGTELSDIAVITSDNPRTEDPMSIIKDIIKGVHKDNYVIIENRREAIKKAMKIAKDDDIIVVAGKGHEDYQILKDKTIHFDEREVIAEIIKEL